MLQKAQVTALLLDLKMKGETVEERTAIAKSDAGLCSRHSTEIQEQWLIVELG